MSVGKEYGAGFFAAGLIAALGFLF
jgi:hypothetical protein